MNTKLERFFAFMMEEKIKAFFSFTFYISFIVMFIGIDLPRVLEIICFIVLLISICFCCSVFTAEWMDRIFARGIRKLGKSIYQEIKKIGKEILMFIPILLISCCIISFLMIGQPVNQTSVEQDFYEKPIFNSICSIIIGPIIEEFIFRFFPHKFIKNKALYIIVSTVIFAVMHVIDDPNAFYYIWFYMIRAWYYAYRYHKTKDILVPISMHSLNNLVSTLILVFSLK